MTKSAGILVYRMQNHSLEVFLVHPGGPFWSKKDNGAWSIPKGEISENEDPLQAAQREFFEETGQRMTGDFIPLTSIRQKSGKIVMAWATEGEVNAGKIESNVFELEWPPRSGKKQSFPEIDRAEWFDVDSAKIKINESQFAFIEELQKKILKE